MPLLNRMTAPVLASSPVTLRADGHSSRHPSRRVWGAARSRFPPRHIAYAREELLKAFCRNVSTIRAPMGKERARILAAPGMRAQAFECDEIHAGARASAPIRGILQIQDLISPGPAVTSGPSGEPAAPRPRRSSRLDRLAAPGPPGVLGAEFKALQERHGPQSVAFLCPGQIAAEELALLGLLARIQAEGSPAGRIAELTDKEDAAAIAYHRSVQVRRSSPLVLGPGRIGHDRPDPGSISA